MDADCCADELGQIGRHRDDLRLQPQAEHCGPGVPLAANLRQVEPGGDAQLRAHRLDEHRHEVGAEHNPQQHVAVLRATGDVGGEVAGIDVGHGGHKGRTKEWEQGAKATGLAAERLLRRTEHTLFAGEGGDDGFDRRLAGSGQDGRSFSAHVRVPAPRRSRAQARAGCSPGCP